MKTKKYFRKILLISFISLATGLAAFFTVRAAADNQAMLLQQLQEIIALLKEKDPGFWDELETQYNISQIALDYQNVLQQSQPDFGQGALMNTNTTSAPSFYGEIKPENKNKNDNLPPIPNGNANFSENYASQFTSDGSGGGEEGKDDKKNEGGEIAKGLITGFLAQAAGGALLAEPFETMGMGAGLDDSATGAGP